MMEKEVKLSPVEEFWQTSPLFRGEANDKKAKILYWISPVVKFFKNFYYRGIEKHG